MESNEKALRFFLGVNSPQGFVSRFDRISDKTGGWRTLIIKGGPGSGKSTLMKKIAEELKDEELELIHCSSDCDSLDAVICPARKFAIADGTAPHVDVRKRIRFCEPSNSPLWRGGGRSPTGWFVHLQVCFSPFHGGDAFLLVQVRRSPRRAFLCFAAKEPKRARGAA